jgi:hypothetical protein
VDSSGSRGVSHRLPVIARASRDYTRLAAIAEKGDLGQRPAQLEGTSALEILGFQDDGAADPLTERARAQHRRFADHLPARLCRALNVLD